MKPLHINILIILLIIVISPRLGDTARIVFGAVTIVYGTLTIISARKGARNE